MDLNKFTHSNNDDDDDFYQTQYSPNCNRIPTFTELISDNVTQNYVESTPNAVIKKKEPKWTEKEDEVLMSAWCETSTCTILGKNQKETIRWKKVLDLYEQSRTENQNQFQLNIRTIPAMKCRYRRINEMVNKWMEAYSKVTSRPPRSGTNIQDDIEEAQALFHARNGVRFTDFNVYHNVMIKHQKWASRKSTFGVGGEISSSNSKRSRSDFEGDNPSSDNVSTPSSVNRDEDINTRPEGREAAKKRKGKAPLSNVVFNQDDASRIADYTKSTEAQVEQRQRRIEADLKIEELRLEKTKTKMEMLFQKTKIEMEMTMLNTLLAKQHLSIDDEEMKQKLKRRYDL